VLYSMTGFGAAEGPAAGGRLRVEIRTVNHRHFNPSLKLPGDLAPFETELRERLRRDFERGHIAVSLRWTEPPRQELSLSVDVERARQVVAKLKELQSALSLPGELDLGLVVRQPDVVRAVGGDETPAAWSEVEPIVARAVADCKQMRAREGAALVAELSRRLDELEQAGQRIAARAPERLVRERDRLRQSVAQLMDGKPADENRLAQEIAFIADRLDITEELVRFSTHLGACRAALAGDQPVGKTLGFLAQELGREVNTMGSKANDAEIGQQVIRMKGELEKLREQLENLE
jgi:uncharacterized protein (TIGR00255 family)